MENQSYSIKPQGNIIEEKKVRPQINFNLGLPSVFTNHSSFLMTIGALGFLSIIFAISFNILLHSSNIQALIQDELSTTSTGAILGKKSPEQKDIDILAEDLINSSPLHTKSFSVEFSYSLNKFVIKPINNNPQYQEDFLDWLNNSDYRFLPTSYFMLTSTN